MNFRDIPSTPLPGPRATFDTHRLQKKVDGTMRLCRSLGTIIFFGLFLMIGLGSAFLACLIHEYKILIFSVPFLLISLVCFCFMKAVRVDPIGGNLTIGHKNFEFSRIAALQVVPSGGSYQLNLVTIDGARRLLVPCGQGVTIRAMARDIAAAIGKIPVIDRELEVEPQGADDAIRAENIAWDPVAPGGTNLRTHRLTPTPDGGFTFKPSFGIAGTLFLIPFFLGGAIGPLIGLWMLAKGQWSEGLFFLLWSAIFGFPLWWYLYLRSKQPVFNPTERTFYRGRRHRDSVSLEEIVALQLLAERCCGSKGGTFQSYELNLVLRDNRRINVVDHGDPKQLRSDAETLAEFLKVPLLER